MRIDRTASGEFRLTQGQVDKLARRLAVPGRQGSGCTVMFGQDEASLRATLEDITSLAG
jgi:hypothetical protein